VKRWSTFVVAVAVLAGSARADPRRPVVPPPVVVAPSAVPNPAYCWPETKLFDTLRYGPVDLCRKKLRYQPGRLECAQVDENVCWVLLGAQWTLTRTPLVTRVIPCPEGFEPPVCPRLLFP
jgi:hypothetical protein